LLELSLWHENLSSARIAESAWHASITIVLINRLRSIGLYGVTEATTIIMKGISVLAWGVLLLLSPLGQSAQIRQAANAQTAVLSMLHTAPVECVYEPIVCTIRATS
jgi:predicted phage tail protein